MPNLPKSKERPWIPKKPTFAREFDNASFYNSKRWRALRNFFIQKNPLCAECQKNKIITSAQVVDHIKPIRLGGSPVDQKNLQSLCSSHHNAKSAREGHEKRKNIKIRQANKKDLQQK